MIEHLGKSNSSISSLSVSNLMSSSPAISLGLEASHKLICISSIAVFRTASSFLFSSSSSYSYSVRSSTFCRTLSSALVVSSTSFSGQTYTATLSFSATNNLSISRCRFIGCIASSTPGAAFLLKSTSISLFVEQSFFISCFSYATGAFTVRTAVSGGGFAADSASSQINCISLVNCTTSTTGIGGGMYVYSPYGINNALNLSSALSCNVRSFNLDRGTGVVHSVNVTSDTSLNEFTFHLGEYCSEASIHFSTIAQSNSLVCYSPSGYSSCSNSYSCSLINNTSTNLLYIYATNYVFYSFVFANNKQNTIYIAETTALTLVGCLADKSFSGAFTQGSGCSFSVSGLTAITSAGFDLCDSQKFTFQFAPISIATAGVSVFCIALLLQ